MQIIPSHGVDLVRVGDLRSQVEERVGPAMMEMWRVQDRAGKLVPAPMELIIRCEGFARRFGGLRYQVRHSWTLDGERCETAYSWEYDHFGSGTERPTGRRWPASSQRPRTKSCGRVKVPVTAPVIASVVSRRHW
ncbi:hypothetical protein [Streptomyces sp. NPDC085665]|uniref:hypothetical protein n=1 Tax=Streptomyces sp. NPDC085665 TaxID=3365735 RepID=UPI0037CD2705